MPRRPCCVRSCCRVFFVERSQGIVVIVTKVIANRVNQHVEVACLSLA
jgi:hypothetical protein